jgi:hypothetical protein
MPIHEEIAAAIHALSTSMDQRHCENITAQSVTERKVDEVIRRVDDLHKAFPGGDWEGHRRYHEELIRKMEARSEFYEDLRSELARKGIWAVLGLVGLAMWQYLKTKVAT